MFTNLFSEEAVPLLQQFPDGRGAGTHQTGWASMSTYHKAVLLLNVGDMAAGATLDLEILQATDGTGTGSKSLTPVKSITQLTQAGGDGSDAVVVNLRSEELDVDGGFDNVSVKVTVAGGAVIYGCQLLGISPRYKPVPQTAWAEVVS